MTRRAVQVVDDAFQNLPDRLGVFDDSLDRCLRHASQDTIAFGHRSEGPRLAREYADLTEKCAFA